MWYKTLQSAMNTARNRYIDSHIYAENTDEPGAFFGNAPRSFNVDIAYSPEEKETYYQVEFLEENGVWEDAMNYASGAEATKIFIECDANKIDLSFFEDDWIIQL